MYIATLSSTLETSADIQDFLSVLALTCPDLDDLYLQSLPSTLVLKDRNRFAKTNIPYGSIRSIFRPVLKRFHITHPYPLDVTLDDINDIASRCPSLVLLILNCIPLVLGSSRLPLEALVPFARNCPNMEVLGLFFESTLSNPSNGLELFKNPMKLVVGASEIDEDVGPVVLFLSLLCPLGCEIHSDSLGYDL
jgi:hypothetical protein